MISYPFFSKKLFKYNILKAISIKTIVVFFMIMMNSIKKVMMRLSITILLLGIRLTSMKNTNSIFVFAQQNNTNSSSLSITGGGSSTTTNSVVPTNNTLIRNTIIPTTTNGTTTTSQNAGVNGTGVNTTLLAKDVTAGNALLKEHITAPVPPTGISTNSAHVHLL
ncbi:MAG: hypothetical protein ACJ71O_01810 [Nitrososphaeraceae archaeon]